MNLLIHIGEVSGDYYSLGISAQQVWRISEDGEVRDTFGKLRYVFEMPEDYFFSHYIQGYRHHIQKKLPIKNIYNKMNKD